MNSPSPHLPKAPSIGQHINHSRGLRIALLGYRSDPFVGGQGIYLHYLSAALRDAGHIVDVYSGPPYPDLAPGVRLIKIPSLDLFASPNHVKALRWKHLKSWSDTFEWFSMLTGGFSEPYTFGRRLLKKIAHEKYDIIHDNQSLCYSLLALQKKGFNVVTTIHHPIHRDRDLAIAAAKDSAHRWLAKRWYHFINMQEKVVKRLENIVTVSHYSRKDIGVHFRCNTKKITVIPNGINSAVFKPQGNIHRKTFQLITTASADQPLKGLQVLLRSLAKLIPLYPNLQLIVVGKLKAGGATEALISELDLADAVTFHSGISTEELVNYYAQSTIAICPSLYEGFGLPVAEAMACGLPVIASDGGALPEVVGDAGIIVPAGKSDALAEAIALLLNSPEKQQALGEKARQRICSTYCWETVASELTQYYLSIVDQHAYR